MYTPPPNKTKSKSNIVKTARIVTSEEVMAEVRETEKRKAEKAPKKQCKSKMPRIEFKNIVAEESRKDDLDEDEDTEFEEMEENTNGNLQSNADDIQHDKMNIDDVKIEQWVKVSYESELFLGKVQSKSSTHCLVRCLNMPYGTDSPQELERENDAIYYSEVYATTVTPELKKDGRK